MELESQMSPDYELVDFIRRRFQEQKRAMDFLAIR